MEKPTRDTPFFFPPLGFGTLPTWEGSREGREPSSLQGTLPFFFPPEADTLPPKARVRGEVRGLSNLQGTLPFSSPGHGLLPRRSG